MKKSHWKLNQQKQARSEQDLTIAFIALTIIFTAIIARALFIN